MIKIFKITESHVRKIVREELKNIILEQMDVPLRGDPQIIAHHVEQGIDPVTYNRTGPPITQEEEQEQEEVVEYCMRQSSRLRPPFSYLDEPGRTGWQQQPSGYVHLTNRKCQNGAPAGWTSSLNKAIELFFSSGGDMGMRSDGQSEALNEIIEYWFANQLLKYDVGFSKTRQREISEPVVIDDLDSLFEDSHHEEELDSVGVNPSGSEELQDLSSWTSENGFDNPYAEDIYVKIRNASIPGNRNKISPDRNIQLASKLYEMQIEIKGDPSLALIKVYRCEKMGPMAGLGRHVLGGWDPLGEAAQYCRFVGYTLNPYFSNRNRNTFI